jgi:hypothetical protein
MNLTERYRAQAAWARGQAEKAATAELREQWLKLAQEYDGLASAHGEQKSQSEAALTLAAVGTVR